jgi:hypothetical protein
LKYVVVSGGPGRVNAELLVAPETHYDMIEASDFSIIVEINDLIVGEGLEDFLILPNEPFLVICNFAN